MSVPMNGQQYAAAGAQGAAAPAAGRVDFGWITQAWQLFTANTGIWITAALALVGPSLLFYIGLYAYLIITLPPLIPTASSSPAVPGEGAPGVSDLGNVGGAVTIELSAIFVFSLYIAFLYGGLSRMAVRQVRGLPLSYRDIFAGGPLFARMLGAFYLLALAYSALQAIGLGPGYLLLFRHAPTIATVLTFLVGGLAWLGAALILPGLLLPAFALMADGERLFPALKRSVRAMKAHWLPAAGFVFVMGLLVNVSGSVCFVGMLATVPMAFLVMALAYRDMAGMPGVLPPPAPSYPTAAPGVWPPAPSTTVQQESNQ